MGSWWLEAIGWAGSAVLVWSLLQTQLRRLRVLNLVGCLILIAYNAAIHVWPWSGSTSCSPSSTWSTSCA
jgi:hypothetical protein